VKTLGEIMSNSNSTEAENYRKHIKEVTGEYLAGVFGDQYGEVVKTKKLSCHDPLCKPKYGSGRFPGSLIGIHDQQQFDALCKRLRDEGAEEIEVFHHLGCGYLFTYLDLVTLDQQSSFIDKNKSPLEKAAKLSFGLRLNFQDGGYQGGASNFLD
jgi:hypothetical protein